MGGEGSMLHMINSLRANNRKRKSMYEALSKNPSRYNRSGNRKKHISEKEYSAFKMKMRAESKKTFRLKLLMIPATILATAILLAVIYFIYI